MILVMPKMQDIVLMGVMLVVVELLSSSQRGYVAMESIFKIFFALFKDHIYTLKFYTNFGYLHNINYSISYP